MCGHEVQDMDFHVLGSTVFWLVKVVPHCIEGDIPLDFVEVSLEPGHEFPFGLPYILHVLQEMQ